MYAFSMPVAYTVLQHNHVQTFLDLSETGNWHTWFAPACTQGDICKVENKLLFAHLLLAGVEVTGPGKNKEYYYHITCMYI